MTGPIQPALTRGLVVWATILDEFGRNEKTRRCVLLTSEDELPPGAHHVIVGITSTLPRVLPPTHVLLPFAPSPAGHPMTKLWKRSAAVCHWLVEVPADALEVAGRVPDRQLADIVTKAAPFLAALRPPPPISPPAQPPIP